MIVWVVAEVGELPATKPKLETPFSGYRKATAFVIAAKASVVIDL